MATVGELARQHTALTKEETTHVVNLIGEWGMLADLCFADLMLHAPTTDGQWVVLAQVRAATGQTLYVTDFVGTQYGGADQPLVTEAFRTGEDLHTTVASQVFGVAPDEVDAEMRRRIKAMSYGLAYGLSAYGLAQQLGIAPDEARRLMDD